MNLRISNLAFTITNQHKPAEDRRCHINVDHRLALSAKDLDDLVKDIERLKHHLLKV